MQKYGNLSPPPLPRGVAELTPQGKPSPVPAIIQRDLRQGGRRFSTFYETIKDIVLKDF